LASYFDFIETGSPEGSVKPQRIQRVLARWEITPDQTAYLGDAVTDIEDARSAGLIPLAAAWDKRAELKALRSLKPAATFETVGEFIDWIATVEPLLGRSPRPMGETPPLDRPSEEGAHH
jgi:phosphoglycolate phosphatase-like HAD superfamily hydrolase